MSFLVLNTAQPVLAKGEGDEVLYLPFEQEISNEWPDLSGYGNDGDGSTTDVISGKVGNAAYFDAGYDDWIDVGNDLTLKLDTSDFTIATWIRIVSLNPNNPSVCIFQSAGGCEGNDWNQMVWLGFNKTGYLKMGFYGPHYLTNFKPSLNTWYHVAVTFQRTSKVAKFYVNGAEIPSIPKNPGRPSFYGWKGGQIGRGFYPPWDGGYFQGRLDELRVYKRRLSDPEVAALYGEKPEVYVPYKGHAWFTQYLVDSYFYFDQEFVDYFLYLQPAWEYEHEHRVAPATFYEYDGYRASNLPWPLHFDEEENGDTEFEVLTFYPSYVVPYTKQYYFWVDVVPETLSTAYGTVEAELCFWEYPWEYWQMIKHSLIYYNNQWNSYKEWQYNPDSYSGGSAAATQATGGLESSGPTTPPSAQTPYVLALEETPRYIKATLVPWPEYYTSYVTLRTPILEQLAINSPLTEIRTEVSFKQFLTPYEVDDLLMQHEVQPLQAWFGIPGTDHHGVIDVVDGSLVKTLETLNQRIVNRLETLKAAKERGELSQEAFEDMASLCRMYIDAYNKGELKIFATSAIDRLEELLALQKAPEIWLVDVVYLESIEALKKQTTKPVDLRVVPLKPQT